MGRHCGAARDMRCWAAPDIIEPVTRAAFISRALLIAALAVGVGHLAAVTEYQRDRALELASQVREPAMAEHWRYQGLVEARTLRAAETVILLAAAAAAGRTVGEVVVLLMNAFALSGLTAAGELWALRYEQILWPVVPAELPVKPQTVVAAHGAIVLLVLVVYSSALRGGQPQRRAPRQRPARAKKSANRQRPARELDAQDEKE